MAGNPWAWGGVSDMTFGTDGKLTTPWGAGTWGPVAEAETNIFVDFVGARHNLRLLPSGLGVSTRCNDGTVVLLRSLKGKKST